MFEPIFMAIDWIFFREAASSLRCHPACPLYLKSPETLHCVGVFTGATTAASAPPLADLKKNPPSRKPQAQPLNIQLRNTSLVATVHTVHLILCIITYQSLICINITQMFSWATMNWLFCELLSKIPWHHLHFRNPLRGKLRCRRRRAHLTLANLFIHGTTGCPTHVGPVFLKLWQKFLYSICNSGPFSVSLSAKESLAWNM